MAGILVRLVLSIGCIAGVLMSHTMAVLFDRSVTLLEKAVLEHSYTSGQKRWLGVRIYGWRFLYHFGRRPDGGVHHHGDNPFHHVLLGTL